MSGTKTGGSAKRDWKRDEKAVYGTGTEPLTVELGEFGYFAIAGRGNPNGSDFAARVETLYALSYAVRMSPRRGEAPEGYYEYAVYPLEGVWDLSEKGRASRASGLDKDELVYEIMIRQPDFVTPAYAQSIIASVAAKKPSLPAESARFIRYREGTCVQALHLGPYESEPATFEAMEAYAHAVGRRRVSLTHREIYLTDARKAKPDKMKTLLRFRIE